MGATSQAGELARETAEFDRQAARLREENVGIVGRLAALEQGAGSKEAGAAAAGTGTGTSTGKVRRGCRMAVPNG